MTVLSDRVSCYRMSRMSWLGCAVDVYMGVMRWNRISDCESKRSCRVVSCGVVCGVCGVFFVSVVWHAGNTVWLFSTYSQT